MILTLKTFSNSLLPWRECDPKAQDKVMSYLRSLEAGTIASAGARLIDSRGSTPRVCALLGRKVHHGATESSVWSFSEVSVQHSIFNDCEAFQN
ncbi:hypothetical protein Moror_16148 [Moniliophthora roreri MCA 2997]|uniref:Uncharacterized protein n=1 Tax=Moniliophthora roreri (strain MCA 2997) TaxID=1381753 RepID=V2YCK8_MONRO|nr:hypothetical protein Moror_16148 [Moniliophthora roreri MCA 2997]